ncbi:hypothetical protein ACJIZ3_008229 [Penstemon smallii]|uniref:Tify domain-containing protein n=1 Tax=Penstemon smallii TaxID=265156 RepID=A0ABD3TB57_9LAMI
MSFQNNFIWMPEGSASLTHGEMGFDTSSRIEQKRPHQWLTDASEQEPFFNKKQAIESVKATSGAAIINNSLWRDSSSSQQGDQIGDRLFTAKSAWSLNVSDKNVPSIFSADMNKEKKGTENQIENDSSICLSMSQTMEDPLCLNTGLQKVNVNEARISENCLPDFVGNSFPGEKNKFQSTSHTIFPGPTYSTADGNTLSVSTAFSKIDKNFISVGQSSSKGDGNLMLSNQYYDGIDNNTLSIGQSLNRGNYSIDTIGENYEKTNGNTIPIGPTYSKSHENLFGIGPFYNKVNEMFMSAGSNYNKRDGDVTSMTSIQGQQDATVASLRTIYNKDSSSILSMGQNSNKGEQTTISFGGFQDNPEESDPSARLISSYDILLNQSSAQSSGTLGLKDAVEQLNANAVSAATSGTDGSTKNKVSKTTKKVPSNNFPSNVKCLLSTGILDGVPVKYVSWSREKNLRGVVTGTGYLCGCTDCKLSKSINAYEFERHAGCKTKHPNNHIYFENGKTIYAVAQELKSTPQDMLFEVIQNVTGSPVNQKNFNTWKASYEAATRELQRIYGRDEVVVPSLY